MASIQELLGAGIPVEAARQLGFSIISGLTAAGSTSQANSFPVTTKIAHFSTVGANTGARLPPASRTDLDFVIISNSGANALLVFPSTGEDINALGANASMSLAAAAGRAFYRVSALKWVSVG